MRSPVLDLTGVDQRAAVAANYARLTGVSDRAVRARLARGTHRGGAE
jgi:hypothetical protein